VTTWDVDLLTCRSEVCESLAYAEIRRRHQNGHSPQPEKLLSRALLRSLETLEDELRLDSQAELLEPEDIHRIDEYEREQTARVLSELHELERRYPPRAERERAPAVLA
jgi:hypothetical protein